MFKENRIRLSHILLFNGLLLSILYLSSWPIEIYTRAETFDFYLVIVAWALIVFSAIYLTAQTRQKWTLIFTSIFTCIVVFLASLSVFGHVFFSPHLELLQEMEHRDCKLRLYQGSGTLTSFWLVVRKECDYFYVFQTREELLYHYDASRGFMTLTEDDVLILDAEPSGDEHVRLKTKL